MPWTPFALGRQRDGLGNHDLEAILQRGKVGLVLSSRHHGRAPGCVGGVRIEACQAAHLGTPILRSAWPAKTTAHAATLPRDDLASPAATVGGRSAPR